MRDLLDLLTVISEETSDKQKTLSPAVLLKRPGRFENFIKYIAAGDKPFLNTAGEQVFLDPKEAKRLLALQNAPGGTQFKGSIQVKTSDGEMIPLSTLLKTKEFGGEKEGSASGEDDEEGEGQKGKSAYLLNPSQIKITDKDMPAEAVGSIIMSNPVLKSTDYGQLTINLAQQIMSGECTLPENVRDNSHEKLRKALVDNAGEYLGILALLYGLSKFEKRDKFEEWLGGSLGDLIIRFPSKQNEKLADSYAEIKNSETAHTVKISSKGTGGGAPPSMTGLKVPEHIAKNKKYKALNEFIEMSKNTPTKAQPFRAMNIIYQYNPKIIPKQFSKFLPWTDRDIMVADESLLAFKANRKQESRLPMKYQSLIAGMESKGGSSDGGKLMYVIKKAVLDLVNNENAIPNFESGVLEILDMNFVQQYATYANGQIKFQTQWPAKLDGKVTIESKSGSTDPTKGGFSFKLAPVGNSSDDLELPDEGGTDVGPIQSDDEFTQSAAQIASGRSPKSVNKVSGNIGRKRR